jgi:hypothetical protein
LCNDFYVLSGINLKPGSTVASMPHLLPRLSTCGTGKSGPDQSCRRVARFAASQGMLRNIALMPKNWVLMADLFP